VASCEIPLRDSGARFVRFVRFVSNLLRGSPFLSVRDRRIPLAGLVIHHNKERISTKMAIGATSATNLG
jgi:hypothetical protein